MGSRAVVIVCRDEAAARKRFRVSGGVGSIYTRTGRRFFSDQLLEDELLRRVHAAIGGAQLWDELKTDWVCLDTELMPWSAKAQDLLRNQYAAVGSAASAALAEVQQALERTDPAVDAASLVTRNRIRMQAVSDYVDAYRRYCWPVRSVDDLRLAPFHLLATEGAVHLDKNHEWHMEKLAALCGADSGVLKPTVFNSTPGQAASIDGKRTPR